MKLAVADLKNPHFGTRILDISYTGRVIANFMFKYPNFCYGHVLLTAVLACCKSR